MNRLKFIISLITSKELVIQKMREKSTRDQIGKITMYVITLEIMNFVPLDSYNFQDLTNTPTTPVRLLDIL